MKREQMEAFTIHKLGIYPLSKYYIEQLKMPAVFEQYMPKVKGSPILSECLSILVQNIVVAPKPLYEISEWLKSYADGQGEFGYEAKKFTDDRLGDALDALYKSDRQSIMTQISCKAIAIHELAVSVVHNDSTTITMQGAYDKQEKEGVQIKHGYNKDHRPDCKQIVFGLNVVADGHVPISMNLYDGNTSDDQTHVANWDELRSFLGEADFCYIADSKAATHENMTHIDQNKGKFISLLPATRKEARTFKQQLHDNLEKVTWTNAQVYPNARKVNEPTTYRFFEDKKTVDGFRLIWVHSDAKEKTEQQRRTAKIARIENVLKEMQPKLNRYNLKTKLQIEQAAIKAIKGYSAFFKIDIKEHKKFIIKKIGRGRPTPNSKYKQIAQVSYSLDYTVQTEDIKKYEQQDGIFPLVTNTDWKAEKILKTYKEQPHLEKRFNSLKSVLEVAPIFLKKPKRIEAMLLLYFLALMVVSLIERQIRKSMKEEKTETLPILPQGMKTKSPTINNLRYLFRDTVMLVINPKQSDTIAFLKKGFDKIHKIVLKLLKIPIEIYQIGDLNWWKFQPS